LLKNSEKL